MKTIKHLALRDSLDMLFSQVWKVEGDVREISRLERRAKGHLKFFLESSRGVQG